MIDILSNALPRKLSGEAKTVAVIRLSGVIGTGGKLSQGISLSGLAGPLEKAFTAGTTAAVALVINSPGGSAAQSMLIYRRIRALAEETGKPVFAFAEDAMASGGYLIACAADEIFADPASIVGSIGVISAGFGFPGLLDKLGVERRVYTAGTAKSTLDPFLPEKTEDVERLKEVQGAIHTAFTDIVGARRAGRLSASEDDLFSGAFWAGEKAKDLGLIDGLGDVRSVMRRRFGTKVKLKAVIAGGGLLRRAKVTNHGPSHLMPASWLCAQEVTETLEMRAWWSRLGL